VRTRWWR